MLKDIPRVLLLVDTSREAGRKLLYGITKYSHLHGPWKFNRKSVYFFEEQINRTNRSQQLEEETLSRLDKWGANGIISTNVNDPKKFTRLLAMGLPTIILGDHNPDKSIPGWHRIRSDSVAIGKVAAEHLLDCGFRNFAYCGYYKTWWSEERGLGFLRRIEEAGFEVSFFKPPRSQLKRIWENEQTLMADWLKSLPKPLGIMACNDDRGQNILEACQIADLNVPDEVAVIGVDNDILVCEVSEPPLSSIPLNNKRAGYEGAELLAKLMAGEKLTHQEIVVQPTDVVIRESTDGLAIEDGDIAKAVRFIRHHATEMIQVSDVVNVVPMSRRKLQSSFRRLLGRSVFEEIKRVHIDKCARMLVETNMSISQIAAALGHPSFENMNRYFRSVKGMSPTAYRKKYGLK